VVCCPEQTTEELENGDSHQERDAKEEDFFNRRPWSAVKRDHVGVPKLRDCLSSTLYKHVKETFPEYRPISERS